MEPWYADSPGRISDCRNGYSFFFDLIDPLFEGRFNPHPFHRMCSLMRKMDVSYLLQETLRSNPAISREEMALAKRLSAPVTCRATRITFFHSLRPNLPTEIGDIANDYCLAYVILMQAYSTSGPINTYIFDSVVHTPSRWGKDGSLESLANYYISMARKFEFLVGTPEEAVKLSVHGSFFCQQNTLTHVCAHSALRMAINNSEAREAGRLLLAEDINQLLGYDHIDQFFGTRNGIDGRKGLDGTEISKVAHHLGYRTHGGDFKQSRDMEYQDVIYPIVESGCPLILGISCPKEAHVVTVLGHTRNSDRWMPEAIRSYGATPLKTYISTASWADHFIISDDNYGAFVTLHSEGIAVNNSDRTDLLSPNLVVGIMPAEIKAEGSLIEQRVSRSLPSVLNTILAEVNQSAESKKWIERLKQELVCRTLLQTRDAYCQAWVDAKDQHGQQLKSRAIEEVKESLPSKFWVTELTLPQLYSGNKRKLGDVINSCDELSPDGLTESLIGLILPNAAFFKKAGVFRQASEAWNIAGHVPLLRGEWSKNNSSEW